MINHIAFLTWGYPSRREPHAFIFVSELVKAITRQGVECTVITPYPLHKYLRERRKIQEIEVSGNSCHRTLRPLYFSFSDIAIGPFNTAEFSYYGFRIAAYFAMRYLIRRYGKPDAFYGHFLYPSGWLAVKFGEMFRLPSFVAIGESTFWSILPRWRHRVTKDFKSVTGVIVNSSYIKRKVIAEIKVPEERIKVFPNGVDLMKFYPLDKRLVRSRLGFPMDKFIIAYVGHFNHEKGILRLEKALEGLESIGTIYLGKGPLTPQNKNVLFKGLVPHDRVAGILAAADIFVLPTLNEGCCNAILEAMACGLPVISSNGEFNNDILNDDVSIRIDPMSIEELRAAIVYLQNNPQVRERMGYNAREWVKQFDINLRAKRILKWMKEMAFMASANSEKSLP